MGMLLYSSLIVLFQHILEGVKLQADDSAFSIEGRGVPVWLSCKESTC